MAMTLSDFKSTLLREEPPAGLMPALLALWWARKGNWETAHRIVMDATDRHSAWVHAYLHRVEGDLANAGYWYRQAKRTVATGATVAEWEIIAAKLIQGEDTRAV